MKKLIFILLLLPFALQAKQKVVKTKGGRHVKVVGSKARFGNGVNSPLVGSAIEVSELQGGYCQIVMKGKSTGVNDKKDILKGRFTPVLIPNSCTGNRCYWAVILPAKKCVDVADSLDFVGSTIGEMPVQTKRCVRHNGGGKQIYQCSRYALSWFGVDDLNFTE